MATERMTTPERELAYQNWSPKELARALIQAEDEIKNLEILLREATEERAQYAREARDSATIVDGVLRVLRDNGVGRFLFSGDLPDDSPMLRKLAERPRRFEYDAQSEYAARVRKEAGERATWSPS